VLFPGIARGAQRFTLSRRLASSLLLPPTLVVEGADQPFCLEIVAAQASIAPRPGWWFMAAKAYNAVRSAVPSRHE